MKYVFVLEFVVVFGGFVIDCMDIVGIFIFDFIKVDFLMDVVCLVGGVNDFFNLDDEGFYWFGIFGGDVLISEI